MKVIITKAATSNILQIFVADSSSTTGAGLTGLVFNSASLTAYYHRDTDTTATAITLVTMTVGTFTSSGFKEIDATNMPGFYQFCPPNACFASGAASCAFLLKGASNMAPLPIEAQLSGVDLQDTVRGGMTALPNAAAGANTGLPVVGTQVPNATAGASGGMFIAGSNAATTANITGNITGNLTGSVGSVSGNVGGNVVGTVASVVGAVGSVTGAVGSVTGNVGGNVVGTVASVVGAVGSVTGNIGGNLLGTLTSTERNLIGSALLKLDWTTVTGEAARSCLNAFRILRNLWSISGSTLTVCKEDDSTAAYTSALTTSSSAQPVTASDPT